MLKKICITLSLLSFFQSVELNAQNEQLSITYDYYFERNHGDFKINLLADKNRSHQTIIRNFRMQNPSGEIENITEKRYIYEDLDQQEIYFWEEFVDVYIKESLNTMTWELTGNTKNIFNYT